MKPGVTTRPSPSISRAPRPTTVPTSASRPSCTATSPRRPGALVPSTISPPRITRSWVIIVNKFALLRQLRMGCPLHLHRFLHLGGQLSGGVPLGDDVVPPENTPGLVAG